MSNQVITDCVQLGKEVAKVEKALRTMRSRTILVALRDYSPKPSFVRDLQTQFEIEILKSLPNKHKVDELLDELEDSVPITSKAIFLAKQPVTVNV